VVKGINYVVELHHKGRSIRPKVVDVDELRLTGEGDIPLTTRLGGITATAVVDGKLDAFLAGVADYRDVALELYFTVGFDAKLNLLFSGVADRGGWEREKTPTGERIQMAFVTALGAAEPVDLNDATTARAYDTMPYGDAITLIARAAGVDIKGSLGDVDLNNFSTVRRVRRDLGDDKVPMASGRLLMMRRETVEYPYVSTEKMEYFHKKDCKEALMIPNKDVIRYVTRQRALIDNKKPCPLFMRHIRPR